METLQVRNNVTSSSYSGNLIKRKIQVDPRIMQILSKISRKSISSLSKHAISPKGFGLHPWGSKHSSHIAIQDWIRNCLNLFRKKKDEEGISLIRNFVFTLWGLWLHRNEIFFSRRSLIPNESCPLCKIIIDNTTMQQGNVTSMLAQTKIHQIDPPKKERYNIDDWEERKLYTTNIASRWIMENKLQETSMASSNSVDW